MAGSKALKVCGLLSAFLVSFGQAQSGNFNIVIGSADVTPSIIDSFVDQSFLSQYTNLIVDNQGIPTVFSINSHGILKASGDKDPAIRGTPGGDGQVGIFFDPGYPSSVNLKCEIENHDLLCTVGPYSVFVACTYNDGTPDQLYMTQPGAPINSPCQLITLKAKMMT